MVAAFSNLTETKRTLREVKLLRHFKHPNVSSRVLLRSLTVA